MMGQLGSTVFDCSEPAELAAFYAELSGATVVQREDDWVSTPQGGG